MVFVLFVSVLFLVPNVSGFTIFGCLCCYCPVYMSCQFVTSVELKIQILYSNLQLFFILFTDLLLYLNVGLESYS